MVLGGGPCPGSEIHDYNPFYSDGFSHTDKHKSDGFVQYLFQGVPDRQIQNMYVLLSLKIVLF